MLLEIAAEVLQFLSRRDLDKASAVSKWLDALIAQYCDVYPLRPVLRLELLALEQGFKVSIREVVFSPTNHSFSSMGEALRFTGSLLRHSHVQLLMVGEYYTRRMPIFPDQWTSFVDAIRSGAVRQLHFIDVDLSALDNHALLAVVRCRGLESLVVRRSVVRGGFVTDDLMRTSVAMGTHALWLAENESDVPHNVSDEAVLDFFFPADAAPGRVSRSLEFEGTGVTDMFVTKFFERLLLGAVRPSGSLKIHGAVKQRGLSAYAPYMAPGDMRFAYASYRFPSNDDEKPYYDVELCDLSSYLHMRFCFVRHHP